MLLQRTLFAALLIAIGAGCVTNRGDTPEEKRQAIHEMKNDVLNDLYAAKQSARAEVSAAPGYAVFSNASINVILASFGGGYGVVHNNVSGQDTYMKMGELGIGLGAGIKDYRIVFVFHDAETMDDFVRHGWAFGGQADAAVKAGEKGAAVGTEAILDRVTVYQLTESGLALQATVKGTKYWRDSALN